MRQFLTSLLATACLVGIVMQFERPIAQAVAIPESLQVPAPPAPAVAPAKPVAKPTTGPVRYVLKTVCNGNSCKPVYVPVTDTASGTNCNCGCGCSSCNCGYQPVQQADPVRRGLFQRRGLFGGRLFSGRLFGRGCCR